MHQPASEPRASIYFDYQVHQAWRPPAGEVAEVPVVIVGAGPVGLTLALLVARHGTRCVVLEAERQVSEGSRAIVFTRRSMEILQQAGVAEAVTARGLPWRVGHSHYRGQRVFRMEAPHPDDERFGPLINLQQQVLEQLLVAAVARQPLIELRWGQKVLGLADAPGAPAPAAAADALDTADAAQRHAAASAPVLVVDTPFGDYRQPAQWVVATDGARSALRQGLGLRMEGDAYEGRFVIADIRVDLPLPTERLAYFDPPWNPGNTVLVHREPQGIWRIDYQLPAGELPEQALAPDALASRINAQLAMMGHGGLPWTLDWCSVYSARAMTLPDYRCGRVLLAGDAAHLLPIFGVRGANTGFQDAQNLGWKLALVARGLAPPALLDSYSAERVQAAREIIAEAGRSTRFMTPPTPGFRTLRDATLGLSLTQDFVGPLFHWRTSRAHDHLQSSLNASAVAGLDALDDDDRWPLPDAGGPGAAGGSGPALAPRLDGAVMPAVRLGDDRFLLDLLDGGFTWLHVAPFGPVPEAVQAAAAQARAAGVPCRVLAVRQSLPVCELVAGADLTVADSTGRAAQQLAAGATQACWLVRPDQHVAGRWRSSPSLEQARRAMARALANDGVADRAAAAPELAVLADAAAAAGATPTPAPTLPATATATATATAARFGGGLGTAGLETLYDLLAEALDSAPADARERLLVQLVLLLAHRGSGQALDLAAIRQALADAAAH